MATRNQTVLPSHTWTLVSTGPLISQITPRKGLATEFVSAGSDPVHTLLGHVGHVDQQFSAELAVDENLYARCTNNRVILVIDETEVE
jgi:hypothetical protein